MSMASQFSADVIVIGSGFGGSVAALRLAEKGYSVIVVEAGRRFEDKDFAKNSWHLRRFLWAPKLGLTGIQRIHVLKDVAILAGAGVGGGSLVYANTLYRPPDSFYQDPQWAHIADWKSELAPHFDTAEHMLGVAPNPRMTPSDEVMKSIAEDMGVGHTFALTPVGVFFGEQPGEEVPDPYFGGKGPSRRGCIHCGECMTGCRHNAKNTLPKNYLALAEDLGVRILPLSTATSIEPLPNEGYSVQIRKSTSWFAKERTFTARDVIIAAGAYNTQKLLLRMRDSGKLPNLSPRLGSLSRTNSESILGAVAQSTHVDYTEGVAITSSWYPDEHTHVEPVRYGHGSNAMGLLQSVLTTPRAGQKRWATWLQTLWRERGDAARLLNVRRWSERSVISLVMQPVDNSLTVVSKRSRLGRWKLTTLQGDTPAPSYIPVAHDVVRRMAEKVDGIPGASIFEDFDAALTAHFVGGAVIGDSWETGVIDKNHGVFGYPGLHVVDGAAITANLGVNPSLTITAQAERAMSLWPHKNAEGP
jgi:cholesterol oxidase